MGTYDSTRQIVFKRVSEKVLLEENSTVIWTHTYGHSWIVGSSTNGIVGTNTNTQDGLQQVVGGAGRVLTKVYVVNPNNTFREHFCDTSFEDSSSTTANWGGVVGECSFVSGDVAQSLTIAKDGNNFSRAIIYVDDDSNVSLYLSADGGSNWESVSNGVWHSFTNVGDDLRFKIVASGNATIKYVVVKHE